LEKMRRNRSFRKSPLENPLERRDFRFGEEKRGNGREIEWRRERRRWGINRKRIYGFRREKTGFWKLENEKARINGEGSDFKEMNWCGWVHPHCGSSIRTDKIFVIFSEKLKY
jgi:hypothetical protein